MLEDYTYKTEGKSESPAGWLIRCTAKPEVVGLWNRIDLVVSEDGTLPYRHLIMIARTACRGRCIGAMSRCWAAGFPPP